MSTPDSAGNEAGAVHACAAHGTHFPCTEEGEHEYTWHHRDVKAVQERAMTPDSAGKGTPSPDDLYVEAVRKGAVFRCKRKRPFGPEKPCECTDECSIDRPVSFATTTDPYPFKHLLTSPEGMEFVKTHIDNPLGVLSDASGPANVALSVWSNTCNAYCDDEDATHAPECRLAAGLYYDLASVEPAGREVWDDRVAPGGYVCSVCGMPSESEPCEHLTRLMEATE